jgi:hypothetical protein
MVAETYKLILTRNAYREMREAAMRLQYFCRTLCILNQFVNAKGVAEHAQKMIRGYNARRAVEKCLFISFKHIRVSAIYIFVRTATNHTEVLSYYEASACKEYQCTALSLSSCFRQKYCPD